MYNFGVPQTCTSCRLTCPVTKFIVTKFIVTKFSWVRAGHRPTIRFACKYYTFALPAANLLGNIVFCDALEYICCKYCGFEVPVPDLLVNTVFWKALEWICL